ncbi:MAG TPA: hypothetical protein VML54_16005, partial [Candidatus Limnocylindrales bacterium]|nr:hypothetical protein [Candidatus Limnocylindrales bacterium]
MRRPTSQAPMTWMRLGLAALATALVAAAGPPAEAHAPGVVLSAFGSATVDGVLGPGEWDAAARVDFTASLPGGGTVPATLFVMNDRTTLYIAVQLSQGIVATDTAVSIAFDNAHRGQIVVGDDAIVVTPIAGAIGDAVVTAVQGGRATQTTPDTGAGGANNGAAAYVTSGATSVYEIAHPLASGDGTRDFALAQGNTVGFALSLLIA